MPAGGIPGIIETLFMRSRAIPEIPNIRPGIGQSRYLDASLSIRARSTTANYLQSVTRNYLIPKNKGRFTLIPAYKPAFGKSALLGASIMARIP